MVKRNVRPDGTTETDTNTAEMATPNISASDPNTNQPGAGTTVQQPNTGTVMATIPGEEPKVSDRDRKYMEDVRKINNLRVEDPEAFQQKYGYFPRRGDLDTDTAIGGLTKQDRLDVIQGKKSLEQTDEKGKQFRVVDREQENRQYTDEELRRMQEAGVSPPQQT